MWVFDCCRILSIIKKTAMYSGTGIFVDLSFQLIWVNQRMCYIIWEEYIYYCKILSNFFQSNCSLFYSTNSRASIYVTVLDFSPLIILLLVFFFNFQFIGDIWCEASLRLLIYCWCILYWVNILDHLYTLNGLFSL